MGFFDDKDSDNKKRIGLEEVAALAIVGIAKAAALNDGKRALTSATKNLTSRNVPKLSMFLNEVMDDLSDVRLKDFTHENTTNFVKKHFKGKDSTFSRINNDDFLNNKKIDLKTTGDGLLSSLIRLKEIEKNPDEILYQAFKAEYKENARNYFVDTYAKNNAKMAGQLETLTNDLIEKNNLIDYYHDIDSTHSVAVLNKEFINDNIDLTALDEIEQSNFFQDLLAYAEENNVKNSYKDYKDFHALEDNKYDIIENIKNEFYSRDFKNLFKADFDLVNRDATLKDFKERQDEFSDKFIKIGKESVNTKDIINDFIKYIGDEDLDKIALDSKNLKISNSSIDIDVKLDNLVPSITLKDREKDQFIDYSYLHKIEEDIKIKAAGTLPGKMLKVSDYISYDNVSSINLIKSGTAQGLLKNIDSDDDRRTLQNSYINIFNKNYKILNNGELQHIESLDNLKLRSSQHGTFARMYQSLFGYNSETYASNKLFQKLDIGTANRKNFLDKLSESDGFIGNISKAITGNHTYNIIDKIFDEGFLNRNPVQYRKNFKDINSVYSNIVNAPTKKTISALRSMVGNDDVSKNILDAIMENDFDVMVNKLSYIEGIENHDLSKLIKTSTKNRNKHKRALAIKNDRVDDLKKVRKREDIFRIEAVKEVLERQGRDKVTDVKNYNRSLSSIESLGISKTEKTNLKELLYWNVLQREGNLYNNSRELSIQEMNRINLELINMITSEMRDGRSGSKKHVTFISQLADNLKNKKDDYKELTTRLDENLKIVKTKAVDFDELMYVRPSVKLKNVGLEIIENINNLTKSGSTTSKYIKQFTAGRKDVDSITEATMIPYFLTMRLTDPFADLGLNFSNKNTGSTTDMWKSIITKRAVPVSLALTALSYANFETKNMTGTSITGGLAKGIGNVDLGLRKIADRTGIGYLLQSDRNINPISQYLFGEDYQDYNERKDYYENGYDEVRKSRWWTFGSTSEFRGGKISYFQPNYVKRSLSDWKDEGLYGGSDEKWKYSWIPTPRHPLSTVRRLMNPYYLEKKHYYDRPYMTTAPLFSTGTPWGDVLNPTVGEMIKPVRKMHRDENRRGIVDPKLLLQAKNEEIKAKALDKEKANLIKVSEDGITNLAYTPHALADKSKVVVGLRASNGRLNSIDYAGADYAETLPEANNYNVENVNYNDGNIDGYRGGSSYVSQGSQGSYLGDSSIIGSAINSLEHTKVGSIVSNAISDYSLNQDSIYNIQGLNKSIIQKANKQQVAMIEKPNLAKMQAKKALENIRTAEDEVDLLLTNKNHDFISDTLFSSKQLSGGYGFALESIFGSKRRKVRPESADNMGSFKRTFWDANVGGFGGGVMEIARRFFPHQDRSYTEINYIKNTMPEWIPSRFQTGDPYTKVQKGEMRLPGKGYESIHKLRSDVYGRYGALDRMRILGDIAPWSDEYKIWRDVATETIKDSEGKKEIREIKERVKKQSTNHEFYEYKFIGSPTSIQKETIERVSGNTILSTSGKKYELAGIKLKDKDGLSNILSPGNEVNIEFLKKDKDNTTIRSAVYLDGMNINQRLVSDKTATRDENDKSPIASKSMSGQFGQIYGGLMEVVAHAPIPLIHNKFVRVDTALQSYKNEQVYGTSFATWDHPIKGFVNPIINQAIGRDLVGQGIGLGSWVIAEKMWKKSSDIVDYGKKIGIEVSEKSINRTASVLFNATNPGAFLGTMLTAIPKGVLGKEALTLGSRPNSVRNAGRIGAAVTLAGYAYTRADNPIKAMGIFSTAGAVIANQYNYPGIDGGKGALIGAGVGLAISALKNPDLNIERLKGTYVPENTQKKREITEYYDRLEYIKYKGLFEKSARKAKLLEGVNIKSIIETQEYIKEKNKNKINKIQIKMAKIGNSNLNEKRKEELISKATNEINRLSESEQILKTGKYTKSAIAYKDAYESTIYGLKKDATMSQLMRAIPKYEKDYFMSFMKETDERKRKKISKYVSPYERKILDIAWQNRVNEPSSNKIFFSNHHLPGVFWAGWNPRVDLENVKMKTIENEGMLLSDFGIYESQANEPAVALAPEIRNYDKANDVGIGLGSKLSSALNGYGLFGVKVSVSPSASSGIQVISNVKTDLKIAEYNVRQGLNSVLGTRMFY